MSPKTPSQDSSYDGWCEEELLKAYKDAAEFDDFLFGDYDYVKDWLYANDSDSL